MSTTELRDIADIMLAYEGRIVNNDLGLKTTDRISGLRNSPEHLRHMGVSVTCPRTQNTGDINGRDHYRVKDTILVELSYRCNPLEQKLGRRTAQSLLARVRRLLTDRGWESSLHITYSDTARSPHPLSADWYVQILTLTQTRVIRTE